jgi:hypothetical protein
VFHISQLKKCLRVPEEQVPLDELKIGKDLTSQEYIVKIFETSERVTRKKEYQNVQGAMELSHRRTCYMRKRGRAENRISRRLSQIV